MKFDHAGSFWLGLDTVRKSLESPDVVAGLTKRDLEANYMTLLQSDQFITRESELYARIIRETGMKPEAN